MKGLFSLIVTVALGYMLWVYLSPPLQPYLPSLTSGSAAGANVSGYAQSITNHFRSML